jgi:ankyrin repeat protein
MTKDGKLGRGPLHVFMSVSRLDLVEYFLKRGVSPDARDGNGSTPLHIVFDANTTSSSPIYDKIASVRMMLDAGADPNARDAWGETPLMRAARVGAAHHPAVIVNMLVAKGADVNAVATLSDGKQKHVLDYYSENQNIEGFTALAKAGAKKPK